MYPLSIHFHMTSFYSINHTMILPCSTLSKDFPSGLEYNSFSSLWLSRPCLAWLPPTAESPSRPPLSPHCSLSHPDFLAVPEQASLVPSLLQLLPQPGHLLPQLFSLVSLLSPLWDSPANGNVYCWELELLCLAHAGIHRP